MLDRLFTPLHFPPDYTIMIVAGRGCKKISNFFSK